MKLQNKKTGEIGVLNVSNNKYYVIAYGLPLCGNSVLGEYDTLDALMQEWEDYEEPKEYYWIDSITSTLQCAKIGSGGKYEEFRKSIGNYFETKEEAEKAVEKLKAWTRLEDKGFRFTGFSGGSTFIEFTFDKPGEPGSAYKDLDLLFGGKDA